MWRLQTALNVLGDSVRRAQAMTDVEVIVADWGSATPLRETLALTPDTATVTHFLDIPPSLAATVQGNSAFPEVLALNAAARRCRGAYIGRIDQDTLVTDSFMRWLLDKLPRKIHKVDRVEDCVFFVGRNSIPYAFAKYTPPLSVVQWFVRQAGRFLPLDGPHALPWFDAPVGVFLMHRCVWHELHGYDESLLHWGWMETDMIMRAACHLHLDQINLLPEGQVFHLEHVAVRLPTIAHKRNPRQRPSTAVPNDETWGLHRGCLELRRVAPIRGEIRHAAQPPTFWLRVLSDLILLWVRNCLLVLYSWVRPKRNDLQPVFSKRPVSTCNGP